MATAGKQRWLLFVAMATVAAVMMMEWTALAGWSSEPEAKEPMQINAISGSALDGVSTALYRIGDYGDASNWNEILFADAHAASISDQVRQAAADAWESSGLTYDEQGEIDPVDALWHMDMIVDGNARDKLIASFASAIGASNIDHAAIVEGAGKAYVAEGLYLAVASDGDEITGVQIAGTQADGKDLKDYGLGGVTIMGKAVKPTQFLDWQTVSRLSSVSDGNSVQRLLGLSRVLQSQNGRHYKTDTIQVNPDTVGVPGYTGWDGGYYMIDNVAKAVCIQAWANEPPNGQLYLSSGYNGFATQTGDILRAVFYYSIDGPGNIFGSNRNRSMAFVHWATSYYHNHKRDGIPDAIWKDAGFQSFVKLVANNPKTTHSGIRLVFYTPVPVSAGQALIWFEYLPGYPSIITHANWSDPKSYLAGKPNWRNSNNSTIPRNAALRDAIDIKWLNSYHPDDDWFTIVTTLNIDVDKDNKADYTITKKQMRHPYLKQNETVTYTQEFLTGDKTDQGGAWSGAPNQWPENANLWYDVTVREVHSADPGYDSQWNGKGYYSSFMPAKSYTHLGVNQGNGTDDPAERYNTVPTPRGSVRFSTLKQNAFTVSGGTQRVRDQITATCSNIPAGATFKGTVKLNVSTTRGADGQWDNTAEASRSKGVTVSCGANNYSGWFEPSTFGWTTWPGGRYWYDLAISANEPYTGGASLNGLDDGNETWQVAQRREVTASTVSQAAHGLKSGWNNAAVTSSTTFAGTDDNRLVEGGSNALTDQVRLTVKARDNSQDFDTNSDGRFDGSLRFTVATTATFRTDAGKTYTAVKSVDYAGYARGGATGATAGVNAFSYTPSDFNGMGPKWPAGEIWYVSRVTGVKGAYNNTGASCPANQAMVNGVAGSHVTCLTGWNAGQKAYHTSDANAASENVRVAPLLLPAVDSRIGATSVADGTLPADTVTVRITSKTTGATLGNVTGLTLKAKADVYWTPTKGADGDAIPPSAKRIGTTRTLTFATFSNGTASQTYDPNKDANMAGKRAHIGTGYVTYVWRIDKADIVDQTPAVSWKWHGGDWTKSLTYPASQLLAGMRASETDGWRPGSEQAEQVAEWRLAVGKVAHIGNATGAFKDDYPAAGAVLNIQETTDAAGRNLKPGTSAQSITLDAKGEGRFPVQRIRAGETRYYRVWESKVQDPLKLPGDRNMNGRIDQGETLGWWTVRAVNQTGTRGVTLTVTGSSEETGWLIRSAPTGQADNTASPGSGLANQPSEWTQKLGDTLQANVATPITGDGNDVLDTLLWSGLIGAIGMAVATLMITRHRRRRDIIT